LVEGSAKQLEEKEEQKKVRKGQEFKKIFNKDSSENPVH
jgi:hypothetical protein